MKDFYRYFIMGFSALFPLINPPGSAFELLGIVGISEGQSFKTLAKRISINTALFLVAAAIVGPYALRFFGISIEALQLVGGAVLAAMGWSLLDKPAGEQRMSDPGIRKAAVDCVDNCWQSKVFYPLTFPITVGPGSIAVMLTLSAQAKSLQLSDQLGAFSGLLVSVALLSAMIFVCYAYAPLIVGLVPPALAHGVLRIIAFMVVCIGVQISWHGMRALLVPVLR
jgi:multiple antibiotic resistance protein